MESEEYYFLSKNSKQRKFEGSSRRKGRTIRATEMNGKDARRQELVTIDIKTTKKWDAERISKYCRNVLKDGGMAADQKTNCQGGASMKRQKRWELSNQIRAAAYQQVDNPEAPNVSIVERYSTPGFSPIARNKEFATRATYFAATDTDAASGKHKKKKTERITEQNGRVSDKTPKAKYSRALDLLGRPRLRSGSSVLNTEEPPEIAYEFHYACPPGRFPADGMKWSPWRKTWPTKCVEKWYLEEINDYKRGKTAEPEWPDGKTNELVEEEGEHNPPTRADLSFDLQAYLASAVSTGKQKSGKSQREKKKARKLANTTDVLEEEWVMVNFFGEEGEFT